MDAQTDSHLLQNYEWVHFVYVDFLAFEGQKSHVHSSRDSLDDEKRERKGRKWTAKHLQNQQETGQSLVLDDKDDCTNPTAAAEKCMISLSWHCGFFDTFEND